MEHATLLIGLAALFAFFMAWGVGANDVANAMGTSVGSKALTIRQAIIIAIIFECLGALLAGGQVTDTIRNKIIDASLLSHSPQLLVYGMLAALLAAGTWLLLATRFGWPVSTTHSIVGAVLGFGVTVLGPNVIYWHQVGNIALSWVITPFIAGILSFVLFRSVQVLIFNHQNLIDRAKRYVPIYMFLVAFVVISVTLVSGLKHIGLDLSFSLSMLISVVLSLGLTLIGNIALEKFRQRAQQSFRNNLQGLEKIFGVLMTFTACAMAFAHGSNDVANAIGPLAAVVAIVTHHGDITAQATIPFWIMMLGAIGIVAGLSMYGYKVIGTVGSNITQLTPSRGFAAQLATASTVVIASGFGLPISTTQTLVGAVLGVGFARGIGALNLSVIRQIFMSWMITLPAGAIFAIIYFYILKWFLG